MEPTTSTIGGFYISKLALMLSGLLGGLSVSFFYQPAKIKEKGRLTAGAIIGGIAVSAAVALGGVVAALLGVSMQDIDIALGLGWVIGLLSVGLVSWVANYLEKREHQDIVQVVQEARDVAQGKEPAPVKPAAKRAPAKKKAANV
jgi:hypothetical protein